MTLSVWLCDGLAHETAHPLAPALRRAVIKIDGHARQGEIVEMDVKSGAVRIEPRNLAGPEHARHAAVCPRQHQTQPCLALFHDQRGKAIGRDNTLTGAKADDILLQPLRWQGGVLETDILPAADQTVEHNQRPDRERGHAQNDENGERTIHEIILAGFDRQTQVVERSLSQLHRQKHSIRSSTAHTSRAG